MYCFYFIYFRDENKTTITVLGIIVGLLSLVLFIIVGHVLYTRFPRNSGKSNGCVDNYWNWYVKEFSSIYNVKFTI